MMREPGTMARRRRGRRSPPSDDESSGLGLCAEEEEEALTNDPSVHASLEKAQGCHYILEVVHQVR